MVGINAVFFAGMGVRALTAPAQMLRPFGITLGDAASRAEVRAVYGGFGLAIAVILGYAISAPEQVRTGILLAVSAALIGMAFGRVCSAVAGDRTSFYPNWFYGLVEVILAASLWWAG
ncbi:DUF4345 domain-containing protein [Mycolicibacterium aubagnense]|nr:DUF4345 domain-containing protein [Mycolicibacterium aubagnense]